MLIIVACGRNFRFEVNLTISLNRDLNTLKLGRLTQGDYINVSACVRFNVIVTYWLIFSFFIKVNLSKTLYS